ncbi:XRE family transcriptional regulator [Pseudomonas cremoricolorata]|uniref:Repressor n=1 Tax=Pseudomonas cremoricolorata TaxID=157783 RepID=A0A089WVY2_9PSED|nr:S24 family peptidase [Pseudomonas cremoricolorata]AIR90752.1 repressor [Pseudomonas cremoricolorata]
MNESLSQRIKRLRNACGLSQAQLAEACGWKSQSRVGNYEAGTREPTLADISAMAAALGVDPSQLLLDTPAPSAASTTPLSAADMVREMLAKKGTALSSQARERLLAAAEEPATGNLLAEVDSGTRLVGDEVWVAHYDIRAAMGGGQVPHDYPEMLQDVRVSPKRLREMGVSFTEHYHLKLVTGWGQSMAPTIKHRDPLLVDMSIREFVGDGIYLFSHHDMLYIKRLQRKGRDHFKMISDNTHHPVEDIRVDDTYIQARVLLVWNAHLV